MFSTAILFSAITTANLVAGPTTHHVMRTDGTRIICTGATPSEVSQIQYRSQQRREQSKELSLYLDTYRERNISVDFDGDFPEEAEDAVRAAANIWDSYLLIEVPIVVDVTYEEYGEDAGFLARATVDLVCHRYCVPRSLANQEQGRDTNAREAEFEIEIEARDDWYFGLDGNPAEDEIDLIETIMHEIGHGLGFVDGFELPEDFDEDEPTAQYYEDGSYRYLFNWFLWTRKHGWIYDKEDVANPSSSLYEAITGHKLFWGGDSEGWVNTRGEPLRSVEVNAGPVMLWAPTEYDSSSVSHLDSDAYPSGSSNSLMNTHGNYGMAIHTPGPVFLGMLYDMGWELKERAVDPLDVLRCLEGR